MTKPSTLTSPGVHNLAWKGGYSYNRRRGWHLMHTARSSNDPVMLTRMLYSREARQALPHLDTTPREMESLPAVREDAPARRYVWIDKRGMRI